MLYQHLVFSYDATARVYRCALPCPAQVSSVLHPRIYRGCRSRLRLGVLPIPVSGFDARLNHRRPLARRACQDEVAFLKRTRPEHANYLRTSTLAPEAVGGSREFATEPPADLKRLQVVDLRAEMVREQEEDHAKLVELQAQHGTQRLARAVERAKRKEEASRRKRSNIVKDFCRRVATSIFFDHRVNTLIMSKVRHA